MQRAIARQAEAERERRAKVISADGEFQASAKLSQAADVMSQNPTTLQLRYLQTLLEMGVNQNTTIVFPLPIDLLQGVRAPGRARRRRGAARRRPPSTRQTCRRRSSRRIVPPPPDLSNLEDPGEPPPPQ